MSFLPNQAQHILSRVILKSVLTYKPGSQQRRWKEFLEGDCQLLPCQGWVGALQHHLACRNASSYSRGVSHLCKPWRFCRPFLQDHWGFGVRNPKGIHQDVRTLNQGTDLSITDLSWLKTQSFACLSNPECASWLQSLFHSLWCSLLLGCFPRSPSMKSSGIRL